MGLREWGLLGLLALIWASSFLFNKLALRGLPPFTIVALRVSLGAVALWIAAYSAGLRPPAGARVWMEFLLLGLLANAIPFSLIVWGQTHIGAGLASILNATTPFFAVIIANAFLPDEKLTPAKIAGVLVALSGVTVMIGIDALQGVTSGNLLGQIAILGSSLAYGCSSTFARRFRGLPSIITAACQVTASSIWMIPLALIHDQPWTLPFPPLESWTAVLVLALLCTGIAYLIYFAILRSAGATNVTLVTFLIPAGAVLLGMVVLGERLELRDLAGMAAIAAGLALIDGRLLRRVGLRA